MGFQAVQNLEDFVNQAWTEVEKAWQGLVGEMTSRQVFPPEDTVWYWSSEINELIQKRETAVLAPWEQQAISMVDLALLRQMTGALADLRAWTSWSGQYNLEVDPNRERRKVGTVEENIRRLEWEGILPEDWEKIREGLGGEQQNQLMIWLQDQADIFSDFYQQVRLVATVLGLRQTAGRLYSLEEYKDILVGTKTDIDWELLIETVIDHCRDDEERFDARMMSLLFLDETGVKERRAYAWKEALLFSLLVHLVFQDFERLSLDSQLFLLKNYSYRGLQVNVPLRNKLQAAIYLTQDVTSYIDANLVYYAALSEGTEKVIVDLRQDKTTTVKAIFDQYVAGVGDNWRDGFKMFGFLQDLYKGQPQREVYISWLRELFDITFHIRAYDLIDHNWGGELPDGFQAYNEVMYCLAYFAVGGPALQKIVDLLKKPGHKTTPAGMAHEFNGVVDLGQEENQQKAFALTELLHEQGLLAEEDALIEYVEKSGKFQWKGGEEE